MKRTGIIIILLCILIPIKSQFEAYYSGPDTKSQINNWYEDIIVEFWGGEKLVFSRGSGYLPCLESSEGKWFVNEVISRNWDYTSKHTDRNHRRNYVRIIDNNSEKIIIYWRYYPYLLFTKNPRTVHEVFIIFPDGRIIREISQGRAKTYCGDIADIKQVQFLQITKNGFSEYPLQGDYQSTQSLASQDTFQSNPQELSLLYGCEYIGYNNDQSAYVVKRIAGDLGFSILAGAQQPLVNPCFNIQNWLGKTEATVTLNGKELLSGKDYRQQVVYDTEGKEMLIIWMKTIQYEPVRITIVPPK